LGYAHYYAATLVSQSYTVLFVSLFAHACQMAFLYLVENPHIEKIYGSEDGTSANGYASSRPNTAQPHELKMYFRNDMVVLKGFDWMRSSDLLSAAIMLQSIAVSLWFGKTLSPAWLTGQAILWRTLFTWGTAIVLHFQSKNRFWTKHFVKNGEGVKEAFDNWKRIYNLTMVMAYTSFILLFIRMYKFPGLWLGNWIDGDVLLRHLVGLLLVGLHTWTSASIYEVLGDYGWFYGDFFLPPPSSGVKYTGIYRFLNNPEKVIGQASLWGLTLISGSWTMFAVSLFGHVSSFLFLHYVERPHMHKVYGESVRELGGIERVLLKEVRETLTSPMMAPLVEKVAPILEGVTKDTKVIGRRVEDLGKEVMERLRVEVLERVEDEVLRSSNIPRSWKEDIRKRRARRARDIERLISDREDYGDELAYDMNGVAGSSDGEQGAQHQAANGVRRRLIRRRSSGDTTPIVSEDDDEPDSPVGGAAADPSNHSSNPPSHRTHTRNRLSDSSSSLSKTLSLSDIFATLSRANPAAVGLPIPELGVKVSHPAHFDELRDAFSVSVSDAQAATDGGPRTVLFGRRLRIHVTVPVQSLTPRDWVGIYRLGDNPHTHRTTVRSGAKWVYVWNNRGAGDDVDEEADREGIERLRVRDRQEDGDRRCRTVRVASTGQDNKEVQVVDLEVELAGERLPWTQGVWEARLHHDGGYGCVAVSAPFEVTVGALVGEAEGAKGGEAGSEVLVEDGLVSQLVPLISRCLELDGEQAQLDPDADIAVLMGWPVGGAPPTGPKQRQKHTMSLRIVHAVAALTGVEFSWRVVEMAGSVRGVARKIIEARSVMSPEVD
ncbi:phosphatidylethanolamine N-methyltransferase, partial [Gonapodya sp. JEL0774]